MICSKRLENKSESFQKFSKQLEGPSEAVLETSRTWVVMYELLEDREEVESVQLAHSQKMLASAKANINRFAYIATASGEFYPRCLYSG